ncbi:hypothetical protein H0B56_11255 [Haloechinothrix sp. YIM 98757]|uniref:Uncharacterized protein n=1 Tax=Haloechinothrix aidingensis TaxID=2752311 RepID=A0A838A9C5_9PSEU|nr:hypothetical protein [Haloechinothrix aidingensis]MBA0126118.1 hypothetical protein [Haloechinothrix aidingensis]
MGRELRDGNIGWQGLGDVPAYREALEGSAERIGELNLTEMSEQLDALDAEHMQTEAVDETGDEEAEAEEFWQGFGRPLGDR